MENLEINVPLENLGKSWNFVIINKKNYLENGMKSEKMGGHQ